MLQDTKKYFTTSSAVKIVHITELTFSRTAIIHFLKNTKIIISRISYSHNIDNYILDTTTELRFGKPVFLVI